MSMEPAEDRGRSMGGASRRAARARSAQAEALGRSGDASAVPSLLRLLEERPPVRAAVDALRRLGETPLARAISAVLEGDAGPAAELKDPRLSGPLLALLGDRTAWRRAAAA